MIDRRNISNLYPLSPLQEGMLYHALREPESRAYFEQIDFEAPSGLNTEAYQQAWQDLVERHDILRTVFAVRKLPQPLQIVLRNAPLALTHEDLRALPADEAQARIAVYRDNDLAQGFDLTAAVSMRLCLFTLPEGEKVRHRVVWSFHHILLDGWSLAILQSDLDALYAARIAGRRASLPPPAPFSAYIKWLGKRDRKQGLAFWQARLQGLTLPTPVPRKIDARFLRDTPGHVIGECRHPLGQSAKEALPRLAASHGVTVNIVVQCLWGMLLARLHGRSDAAFAATVSGRPVDLPDAGRTVGIFINAVPVRVRLRPEESFADLLARMQAESIESQAWHDCPLPEVQAAHPLRDALFDHILVFENYPQLDKPANASMPDTVSLHEYTHYDFEFQFLPGDPPVLRFRFNQHLFDPATIARIGQQFEDLLLDAHENAQQSALQLTHRKWKAPATLAIAASFTAEPIAESLCWWFAQFACPTEVQLAPYNQCVQQLGDTQSVLQQAELGVLLLRFEDAARDLTDLTTDEACTSLEAQYEMLLSLLRQRPGKPLIVGLLPSAPQGALASHASTLEQRWHTALQALPGIALLDLRHPGALHGLDEVFDPASDRIGHMPYSPQAFDAIAAAIARASLARWRPPFKVIAVDCDNTLWSGVVGEAGPLGVRIEEGHRALQQFLLERQREGFLIALASKNSEDDVWAVIDRHPDMLLRREHIAAAAVNWQPKSGNLKQLASRLNLGIDSVIFIDDSPVECSEVMENCPEALTIPLPADPAMVGDWLAHVWAFDLIATTAEDRERTGMMQAEAQRQEMLGDTDPQAFLEQLQLRIKVGPMQPHQIARVAQLTQRTNQFNLSGKRRDEAEIAALTAETGVSVLAVEVEDRFGAYGLTGVAIVRSESTALHIDTLLLSCRVLGRKVEHALLGALARRALALGHRTIEAQLIITDRNEPIQRFLRQPPWQQDGDTLFRYDVQAATVPVDGVELLDEYAFSPATVEAATQTEIIPAPQLAGDQPAPSAKPWPAFPLPIRNEAQLRHATQYLPLLAACAGWPRMRLRAYGKSAAPAHNNRPPSTATETVVAAIWSEVLGHAIVDAESSFTELGGHSLHAVRTVSRIERTFNRKLSLSQFFSLGNIAALAAWLGAQPAIDAINAASQPIPCAADAPDYPLSHNQQRLWILSRMGAADNLYNLCAAFRLRGALDADALRHAVQRVVAKHEALRSVFRIVGDQPRLAIIDTPVDTFMVCEGRDEETIRAHIMTRSRKPFDLENGPLFCVELHAMRGDDHVLAISLHHIIGDGWSFGLLLNDLAQAYARQTGHAGEESTAAPLRYRDFAVWSRSADCEAGMAPHRSYWLQQLQPLAPIAQMPPDFPRPPVPGGEGGSLMRMLPQSVSQLQSWLSQHQAGLFPMLASLVAVLLHRCGKESSVRLGIPVAGRDRPELEQTVGFFANTVVLAAQLQADDSFATLLNTIQQRVTGALEHQSYPFDRLVEELQPEREPGRNPLFDVMVVLQNARNNTAELPGIEVQDFAIDTGLAAFDLVFEFRETGEDRLACALRYRRDLYRDDTASLLLDRLVTLLNAAMTAPATELHELTLIGPAEQAQLDAFSSGGMAPIPNATLPELFARQAAATPHAFALATADTRLDYRTLDQRANALAWQLFDTCRVIEGDVVAVMLDRTVEWPIAMLGILKAGAVYLPLDLRHPQARLRELLKQSGAKTLIAAPSAHTAFADTGVRLLAPPADTLANTPPPATIDGASPAYLIFTSGSTGIPKGVRVHHRAFINMIMEQVRSFALNPQDVVLQLASCAFDASLSEFFMAWMCGAGVVIADHASARDSMLLRQAIAAHRATVATLTPSHLRQLDDADLAGLRKVILAAEAVFGRDARRLQALGIECFNAYGPTETAVCATLARIDDTLGDGMPIPIGRPLANLTLRIVDEHGRDVPIGVAGELLVLGEGVALGYLKPAGEREERSQAFFTQPDGMRGYRTGDICRWLADGHVEYVGRKDAQLKIRGHRIEPAEITALLAAQDGITQAEVIADQGEAGAFLVAYLCGPRQPDAVLRTRLAGSLPAHMIPARFVWLDSMPLTTSGKLDRAALPVLTAHQPLAANESIQLNALEVALLSIWRELLPGDVDADSDFFAAGGNSLLAMSGARRITQRLRCDCPALQFFRTPTVRSMAAALASPDDEASLQTFGCGNVPVFALPPHPGLDLGYATLARALPETVIHAARFIDKPLDSLIDDYLTLFEQLNARQPVVLLGYSAGGKLALALAHALEHTGRQLRAVVLIDTWRWTEASSDTREYIDAEIAAAFRQNTAQAAAYRTRMSGFEPLHMVQTPVHHLHADDLPGTVPPGLLRDWNHLAACSYCEYRLPGMHHQLLDAAHVTHTATVLRAMLRESR